MFAYIPPTVVVSGVDHATADSNYALHLSADYPTDETNDIGHWIINWGDGTAQTPDIRVYRGDPAVVKHIYETASTTGYVIHAEAEELDTTTYAASNTVEVSDVVAAQPDAVKVTTNDVALLPSTPDSVMAAASVNQIEISWQESGSIQTGFEIDRSTSPGFSNSTVFTVSGGATSFTDTTAAPGQVYYYHVRATGTSGNSPFTAALAMSTQDDLGAHRVDLQFSSVSGATSYVIQRWSATSNKWITLTSSLTTTSYQDNGLTENTTYKYQISAMGSQGVALASVAISATTDPLKLLSDIRQFGFTASTAASAGMQSVVEVQGSYNSSLSQAANQAALNTQVDAAVKTAEAENADIVFDYESGFPLDVRTSNVAAVQTSVTTIANAMSEAHADLTRDGRTDLEVSFYGFGLGGGDTDNANQLAQWQNAMSYLAPIAAQCDFLAPSIYVTSTDPAVFLQGAIPLLQELQSYGKPVYPYIWPNFFEQTATVDPVDSPLPQAYWQLVMDATSSYSDGAVIWRPASEVWNPAEAWWANVTSNYLSSLPSSAPATPDSLTVNPVGMHLSWDESSTNETGFVVERATILNGQQGAWHVVGGTEGNTTTWTDPNIATGTSYVYRVDALNALGVSAPSASVGPLVASHDGLSVIPAIYYDAQTFVGNGQTPINSGTPVVGDLWQSSAGGVPLHLEYENVSFGSAANQITLNISNSGASNQYMDIYVDGLGAANEVGQAIVRPTTAMNVFYTQSTLLTTPIAAGTHTIYLVPASKDLGMLSWFQFGASNAAPAGPRNLTASSENGQVALKWDDYSNGETGYLVERGTDGTNFPTTFYLPAGSTSYVDTTVSGSSTYYYRVFALNGTTQSARSNTDTGVATARVDGAIAATSFDQTQGIATWLDGANDVVCLNSGDWLRYHAVNLTSKSRINFMLASPSSGGTIQIWADAVGSHGTLLGTFTVTATESDGNYRNYVNESTSLSLQGLSGYHDIYLVIASGSGIANISSFQLQ
jgi:hypothetical protein